MGASYSLLYLRNRGFSQDNLKELVTGYNNLSAEEAGYSGADAKFYQEKSASIIYNADAEWLQLYDDAMSDGYIASVIDMQVLAKHFGTTVLSFSVFDSDIINISYYDPVGDFYRDTEVSNVSFDDDDDGDADISQLPDFMLKLCSDDKHNRLCEILYVDECVFVEEKLQAMCELLGLTEVYDLDELPPQYQIID